MNTYKSEVIQRFGNTEAYKEFEQRGDKADFEKSAKGFDLVLKKFSECKARCDAPDSADAQALVNELKIFITNNFYTCTDEILKSLGVMYTADERFMNNIDKHGLGTAEFISSAIEIYYKGLSRK